jgi:hypothetical protein
MLPVAEAKTGESPLEAMSDAMARAYSIHWGSALVGVDGDVGVGAGAGAGAGSERELGRGLRVWRRMSKRSTSEGWGPRAFDKNIMSAES